MSQTYACWKGCRNKETGKLLEFTSSEVEKVFVCSFVRPICRTCFDVDRALMRQCYACRCWFYTDKYRYLYMYDPDKSACITCMRKYAQCSPLAMSLVEKNYSRTRITSVEEFDTFRLFVGQLFDLSDFKRRILTNAKKRQAILHLRTYFRNLGDKLYFIVDKMSERQLDLLYYDDLKEIEVICALSGMKEINVKKSFEQFKFI
jgi:hypothetical protein